MDSEPTASVVAEPQLSFPLQAVRHDSPVASIDPVDEPRCTEHRLLLGDARDLSFLADESIHLVVTSPPYFDLKKYHLAVSCKPIMANVAGTVPNRIDDAIGECANIHAYDPGIVLGYFFVMDKAGGMNINRDANRPWAEVFGRSLASLSGRRSQHNSHDLFEAAILLLVDFNQRPYQVTEYDGTLGWDEFFDTLIDHVRDRNPTLRNRLDQAR